MIPADRGVMTLSATYFHRSGFHLTALDIGVPPDNLTDKAYVTGGGTSQYLGNGYADYVYGAPRPYGVELRYNFGH